ncbi:N,N-dimethylformamidase beta subunit family domain-containing protein [Catellatospora sichuanensis]|uniref:N,N-dimethylformamidase beta subunit family domain-containing protein n=1 Tax=Catellatospora sichuanensis TaxID=1969805 RepID=UPI001C92050A|nr:N,N-dimethylformamidase beta subunit family domain-containing protein [Catellatospora sichuanensis]
MLRRRVRKARTVMHRKVEDVRVSLRAPLQRIASVAAFGPARSNRTVTENLHEGTKDWRRTKGVRAANDVDQQINAYASATSVNVGDSITFHATVADARPYRVAIHRLGHYDGAGARRLVESPELTGTVQNAPSIDADTGMVSCDWTAGWTLDVPDDWTSGLYLAVFTSASGWRCFTPFVVRDDERRARLCVILPFSTYQADNMWPRKDELGRSLDYGYDVYEGTKVRRLFTHRAMRVSFDRPYDGDGLPAQLALDHSFIRWAEREGYDLTYATSVDLHTGRIDPTKYAGLVFPGHDEYWSGAMRDAAEAAVTAGTSLAFLTANNVHWHVRLEPAPDGRPNRVVTCYKTPADPAPEAPGATTAWRIKSPGPYRTEQALLGVQHLRSTKEVAPLVIRSADHWFWDGTGLSNGDKIDNLVTGEADGHVTAVAKPAFAHHAILAASPFTDRGNNYTQNTSLGEFRDGTIVFAAGVLNWPLALGDDGTADPRIQRATRNLLDRILRRRLMFHQRSEQHRQSTRRLAVAAASPAARARAGASTAPAQARPNPSNPTDAENRLAGAPNWRKAQGVRAANDIAQQINAYASATSVNVGESISFHATVAGAQPYRIAIHRLGHYDGAGARLMTESPELTGSVQPPPSIDPDNGMITCDWTPGWTLEVPQDWVSGTYMAVFTSAAGWRCFTPFVVRQDERRAQLCVVMSFTTYQAYNFWPLDGIRGKNLYYGFEPGQPGRQDHTRRAHQVSFDRPYHRDGIPSRFDFDLDFIQWAEREGYDLVYASSIDLHLGRIDPTKYAGLVFPGHDEYWSGAMRDAAEAAVTAGTSLAFLTANNVYWHVRIGAASDGRPDRVVTCYKGEVGLDPNPDERGATVQFRVARPGPGDAEQRLLGVQYNGIIPAPVPLVVAQADHWFWAGTGVADGDEIEGMVGGEADGVDSRHPTPEGVSQTILSRSPYQLRNGTDLIQNTSVYETPNGAIVFAAGSLDWPAGLNRPERVDQRIQRATANVLNAIVRAKKPKRLSLWR